VARLREMLRQQHVAWRTILAGVKEGH
jgi:hypothetical protein